MAKQRTMLVSALNIRLKSPSKDKYFSLFLDIWSLKKSVQVFGDRSALISHLTDPDDHGFEGTIAKFTQIDPNAAWFNFDRLSNAETDDLKEIRIPDHLRPNYSAYFFYFDFKKHLFVFETRGAWGGFSPRSAMRYFENILKSDTIVEKYGTVAVSLVADRAKADDLLAGPGIEKIRIVFQMPNPDDLSGWEATMKGKLRDMKAAKMEIIVNSDHEKSLKLNEELKNTALVSMSNGVVETKKIHNGISRDISSENSPLTSAERYDPDFTSENSAFHNARREIVSRAVLGVK